jgi:2-oxoisovalerate dehydrogenase E1 component beta subunit
VVFLEPTRFYRAVQEEVPDDGEGLALDRCIVLQSGRDVTLESWGAMLVVTQETAARLADEGIDAFDVAVLKPLDSATSSGP